MSTYEDPPDARTAALLYTSLGLHVLPISATRVPVIKEWKDYQFRPATKDEIYRWYEQVPSAGVGIIGADRLVIIDLDDRAFSQWVELYVVPRTDTWITRTGSGKIHLYFYSEAPIRTSILRLGNNKLADVRAGGEIGTSYVAAPPSRYYKDKVEGIYQTIRGSPHHILRLPDAIMPWDQMFIPQYQAIGPTFSTNGHTPSSSSGYAKTILPPLDEIEAAELHHRIQQSTIVRRFIRDIDTADSETQGSNSEKDFALVSALTDCGFGPDEIEQVFATWPCGERCYRNLARDNYGQSYLLPTITNAGKKTGQRIDIEAAGGLPGKNFLIKHNTRMEYDKPLYELDVIEIDEASKEQLSVTRKALADVDDIYSSVRLQKRITDALGIVPVFLEEHLGPAGYQKFAVALLHMAEREEVPTSATTSGHLQSYIITILRQQSQVTTVPTRPANERGFQMGYREQGGEWVYLRSGALIRHVTNSLKPPPAPEKVWGELRKMGGAETVVNYVETGARETLWTLPARMLD